jgi:glycosyltransferase involved in cell wall biosynthesis
MSIPKISVVMSVYNGEWFLKQAIDSILTQTFTDFEFIVINDGSTDETSDILAHYAKSDSRLQVYPQANQGLIASLNRGCSLARAKYIARLDADDVAFQDRLERQLRFLEQNPDVALLGGAMVVIDAECNKIATWHYPLTYAQIKQAICRYDPFGHSAVVIRKDAFEKIGGYGKAFRHAEDYDLWLRIAEQNKVANLAECVTYYRLHPGQVTMKHLHQQVISSIGAQIAAKERQIGHADPLSDVELVTETLLAKLGVDAEVIREALFGTYKVWAGLMIEAGNEHDAIELYHGAVSAAPSSFLRYQMLAKLHHTSGRSYYIQRRWLKTIRAKLTATLLEAILQCGQIFSKFASARNLKRSNHRG